MRKREIMRSRTLVFTAVLGVAAVLLLASTAVAQPGNIHRVKDTALANGVDYIQLNFTVFNTNNDTNVSVVYASYPPSLSFVTLYGLNAGSGNWEVIKEGPSKDEECTVNRSWYTVTGILCLRINSTEPLGSFDVQFKDVGNPAANFSTAEDLDFDASRLNFSEPSITTTAGQESTTITVRATGATGNYRDTEYGEIVRFTLNKTANVWLIHDTTIASFPADVQMSQGLCYIKVNGTQAGVYNLTVNVTGAPWLQNDTMQITINPAAARYITATVDRDSMVAGATTNYTNCTFYILDVFNNINTTAVADVNIAVSSPAAGTNVTNATTPGDFGVNAMTWLAFTGGEGTFRIRIANATMPDAWVTQPCFNITVNATVGEGTWLTPKKPEDAGLPVPSGISTEVNLTTNSTILRTLEVEPADANKIVILKQCNDFQANKKIEEAYNITAAISDQYDNYCIKTTNATGAQIYVTFNITDNRTYAYLSADITPDDDTSGPVNVAVENTTLGIAIAKIYLWSDIPITQNYTLTVNLTNLQGLTNTSTTVIVTPWYVDHVKIVFVNINNATKSELIANGSDVAYIIAYLVDSDDNPVTTADGTNFTTSFKLVYDANNKSEGWICNASACASRIGTLESDIVTAVPTNGVIYGNVTGLYINATATNATACSDNPIQSMNVEANASTPYGYKTGAANISVGPDEPAQVDLQTTVTDGIWKVDHLEPYAGDSQTDSSGLSLLVVVTDAYDNIVRDGTQVWFGATGGVIKTNDSIIDGKVVALTQNGCVIPHAYYKPIFNYTDSEAQYVTASITAYSENSTTLISDTETLRFWARNEVHSGCPGLPSFCDVVVEEIETGKWQINVYFKDSYGLVQPYWNSTAYFYTTAGTITPSSAAFDNGKCSATLELDPGETAEVVVNVGNWGIHNETLSRPYEFDDTLHLKAGWNFVSVPKLLNSSYDQFNELFNTSLYPNISSILYYDPTTGWSSKINTSDYINVLDGYWVYTTEAYDIPLTYEDVGGGYVPPTKDLVGGAWNAIGFSATEPYSAEATLMSVDEDWVIAIGWNATAQAFEDPIMNNNNDDVEMYPGEGYWLFVTDDCTLAALSA